MAAEFAPAALPPQADNRDPHGQVFVRGVVNRGPRGLVLVRGVLNQVTWNPSFKDQVGQMLPASAIAAALVEWAQG
jgi:hypothetical protein